VARALAGGNWKLESRKSRGRLILARTSPTGWRSGQFVAGKYLMSLSKTPYCGLATLGRYFWWIDVYTEAKKQYLIDPRPEMLFRAAHEEIAP
jgi:hypothetical protein